MIYYPNIVLNDMQKNFRDERTNQKSDKAIIIY